MSAANGPSGQERTSMSAANGPSGQERTSRSAANGPSGGDDRLLVDRHLLDALAALPTAPAAGAGAPGPRRQPADGRRRHGALRGPGHQPPPRPGRPLAAGPRPRLLHDRLGRPRGQRRGRRGAASDRPGPPPLPLRRVLRAPGHAGPGTRRPAGRPARPRGGHGRADGRRTPQGLRPPRPGDHPPDLDHRLPPAASPRRRLQHRPRPPPRRALRVAGRRAGRLQLRRRVGQPLDGDRGHQHRHPHRPPAPAAPAPARLRGQRPRDQRAHPARLDPGRLLRTPPPALVRGRRHRSRGHLRGRGGRRRVGPHRAGAGLPAPAHGPLPGPCRHGRRGRVPDAGRDPGRLRTRSHPGHGAPPGGGGRGHAGRPDPPLRAHPLGGAASWPWNAPPTTS